jgi:hypothetical protein
MVTVVVLGLVVSLVIVWALAVRADIRAEMRSAGDPAETADLDPGAQARAASASSSLGGDVGSSL